MHYLVHILIHNSLLPLNNTPIFHEFSKQNLNKISQWNRGGDRNVPGPVGGISALGADADTDDRLKVLTQGGYALWVGGRDKSSRR